MAFTGVLLASYIHVLILTNMSGYLTACWPNMYTSFERCGYSHFQDSFIQHRDILD